MTLSAFFILVLVGWLAFGVAAAVVMCRRGYSGFAWGVLGAVFGPLVIPLAVAALRQRPPGYPQTVEAGSAGGGDIDVLVGLDGSSESHAAVGAAAQMMRGRLRRVQSRGSSTTTPPPRTCSKASGRAPK